MTTNQPAWKCVAQLGDVNPTDHGGYWVFIDETGVYPPEAELLHVSDERGEPCTAHRFILENCTYTNGILSDNRFHHTHPAWFAKPEAEKVNRPQDTTYLSNLCDSMDIEAEDFIQMITSEDPIKRALAWRNIGEYHGMDNLDSYPLEMTRKEMHARYKQKRFQVA